MQAAFQQQTDIHKVEMQERMRAKEAREHMLIAKMQEMLAMTNTSFVQKELDISNMKLELQKLQALKEDKMAVIVQKQVCATQTHAGEAMGSPSEVRDVIEQDSSGQPQKRAQPSFATLMKRKGYQGIVRRTVLVAHKAKETEQPGSPSDDPRRSMDGKARDESPYQDKREARLSKLIQENLRIVLVNSRTPDKNQRRRGHRKPINEALIAEKKEEETAIQLQYLAIVQGIFKDTLNLTQDGDIVHHETIPPLVAKQFQTDRKNGPNLDELHLDMRM
ncbi:hypothetical protein K439DRAFT_1621135 [Ramaria rubella]|nr:hypothetical protein K439DRAFT_1621135 [Ramaria rubella]